MSFTLFALLRRAVFAGEIARGVDEAEVGKACGKYAKLPAGARVVLLAEQTEVVADREQALEDGAHFVAAAAREFPPARLASL